MKIIIAGGTGFLGGPLAEMYAEEGHDVRVLTRSLMAGDTRHDPGTGVPGVTRVGWKADGKSGPWSPVLEGSDAVVNLAGESIAAKRWTPQRKAQLRDSRILATRSLASAIAAAANPPPVFISGSAVGYYGPSGSEPKTEDSPPGADFLSQLCVEWERGAAAASRPETRLVLLRTGIVLERSGGALAEMMRPFRFFAGGRIGSGRQYVSWIHRLDWIEMVRWIVQTPQVSGAVNATAPSPVTNRQLTKALGHAMRRPSLVPAPAFALKVVLGEMAESILTGQRVLPARARALGYHFRYPEIDQAFRGIFGEC
ncbi:MAG TPA: TIGR01777 family oxidoreductase [Vicinamibacterales bacterium]|nr:TIGR01777 family oxidoreductase [Vicinamibacterales bacterium]